MSPPPPLPDPSRDRRRSFGSRWPFGGRSAYDRAKGPAREIKSVIQMALGVLTLVALTIDAIHTMNVHAWGPFEAWKLWTVYPESASKHLLGGVGVGLAAAAAVELAYTLFTPGPDEALNPLMLSLASATLLIVGGLDEAKELTVGLAVGLLLLGVLLAVLFATRLFLAEDDEEAYADVWWVRKRLGLPARRSTKS